MSEKRKRCPNGTRKNKKGKCVKKKKKVKKSIEIQPLQDDMKNPPEEIDPMVECKKLFETIKTNSDLLKLETKDFFSIKKCQSKINLQELKTSDKYNFLYPHLDDSNFTEKITKKKNFLIHL